MTRPKIFHTRFSFSGTDRFLARRLADWFKRRGIRILKAQIHRNNIEVVEVLLTRLQLKSWAKAWRNFTGINTRILARDGTPYERPKEISFILDRKTKRTPTQRRLLEA